MRDFFGDEAEALLRGRVQVINLWRPIRGPLRDAPLAVCDVESVAPGDLVASDLVYQHRVGEIYGVTFNPSHGWFYVPQMQPDEALLLKCFKLGDGRSREVRAAHRVRGSDHTGGRAAAREHRDPDAGVPRGLNKAALAKANSILPLPLREGGRGRGPSEQAEAHSK